MTATCPQCGRGISGITTTGPDEHVASPCGHRVGEQTIADLQGSEAEIRTDGCGQSSGGNDRSIAESRGEYVVDTHENTFGHVLEHGLEGGVIYMVLVGGHGWRAYSHESGEGAYLKMPHQTYRKHVEDFLQRHPNTREVAVLAVDTGDWRTVWLKDGEEAAADNRPVDADTGHQPDFDGGEEADAA